MPLLPLTYRGVEKSSDGHLVAGGVAIDADTPVVMSANGARTARGLSSEPFLGFAERGADNLSGPDGDVRVLTYRRGSVLLDVAGVDESTPVGSVVFTDGTSFSIASATGRETAVGWLRDTQGAGRAWVRFVARALGGPTNAGGGGGGGGANHALGLNTGYFRVWAPGTVYRDLARNAQPWFLQRNSGDWSQNTPASPADADGYPTQMPAEGEWVTTLLTNQDGYPGGAYTALYDGVGTLVFGWDAVAQSALPGQISLQITPSTQGIYIRLTATQSGNHLRNLRIVPAS